ncbi:hypothetical protein G6F43_000180 [Rhizopus delemar]|nr:hypothetical protein G6F43_000180 [Rhizopus delemar]
MPRFYATAFQSTHVALTQQTRQATLGLYRSLLRSSKKYEQNDKIKNIIQQKFRANRHITSRPKVLELLSEANKINQHLQKPSLQIKQRVSQYLQNEIKEKKQPEKKKIKKKKHRKRKPYQVALTVTHSSGYQFKRVRGWVQPVKTSMIIKKFTKTVQKRLDRYTALQEQLDMVKKELQFEISLGIRDYRSWLQCEKHIRDALEYYHKKNLKMKTIEETDEKKNKNK